jgi:hypothetical protein
MVVAEIANPAARGALIPPLPTLCGQAVEYSVVAYVYGRQSPPSPDTFSLENPPCSAMLFVTWDTLTVHTTNDDLGGPIEGFGVMAVNGVERNWNFGAPPPPPLPATAIEAGHTYNWADMPLTNHVGGAASNVTLYSPAPGDDVSLVFALLDHDPVGSNESFCFGHHILPGRTTEEWAAYEDTISIDGVGDEGSCTVDVHIGGAVLPPPAVIPQGELRNLQILYESDAEGELTLRFFNIGPSYLLNETVQIQIDYDTSSVAEGLAMSTTTVEEVEISMPVDTMYVMSLFDFNAPEGWTTEVTVRVEPVTFMDPDMSDNEVTVTIDRE